jgi:methionine-rich copper-binding protein CopC
MKTRIYLAAALIALPTASWAHALLKQSDPAQGATLTAAPKGLALTFTEKLESRFSGVAVTDAQGHDVEAGKPAISGAAMTVKLKQLPAGVYHVAWHVISVDTYRTEGMYDFTVRP